jgi:two-component system, cell cycle sensor histidine kinase and response regulator CckA
MRHPVSSGRSDPAAHACAPAMAVLLWLSAAAGAAGDTRSPDNPAPATRVSAQPGVRASESGRAPSVLLVAALALAGLGLGWAGAQRFILVRRTRQVRRELDARRNAEEQLTRVRDELFAVNRALRDLPRAGAPDAAVGAALAQAAELLFGVRTLEFEWFDDDDPPRIRLAARAPEPLPGGGPPPARTLAADDPRCGLIADRTREALVLRADPDPARPGRLRFAELLYPVRDGGALAGFLRIETQPLAGDLIGPMERAWGMWAAGFGAWLSQQRAQQQARDAEQRYRELVEQVPGILYRVDLQPAPRTVYISPQLHTMLGFAPETWTADPELWIRRLHPEDRERVLAEVLRHNGTGEPFDVEYRTLAADGRVVWVRNQARYLPGADGRPRFVQGMMLDITPMKTVEQALEDSERKLMVSQKLNAIGRLAGGVAHDLNNLLTPVIGYAELLRDREGLDAEARADVEEIVTTAKRASDLTHRLLSFGRRQPMRAMPVSLSGVVRTMEKLLRRTLGEDIDLRVECPEEEGWIRGDPAQIEQVVMNLAVNAREAMPRGGRLSITVDAISSAAERVTLTGRVPPGEYVRLRVRDTGHGVSPEIRERMFEPFFSTKPDTRNSGLGLATVYGVVSRAGGFLDLDSAPGRGAEFTVLLPREQDAGDLTDDDATTGDPRAFPAREGETVLIAEDEEGVRGIARRHLAALGYQVIEARNGMEALDVARRTAQRVDLLLTDVVMPGMTGVDLARSVAAARPHCRVVYMSGFAPEKVLPEGGVPEGALFILKPFNAHQLARMVRRGLDASRAVVL